MPSLSQGIGACILVTPGIVTPAYEFRTILDFFKLFILHY